MTMKGLQANDGRHVGAKDLAVVKKAAFVAEKGRVVWVGRESRLPTVFRSSKRVDCQGLNVFPGFVDCHTHMVFAGDRVNEFEKRNQGASYQEIAAAGGGILSTVKATRKVSKQALVDLAQQRVGKHLSQGVTTIEIKSGYGLNPQSEIKMLQAAKALKKARVVTTYLGAHAIPSGTTQAQYLESLKRELPKIKQLGLSQRVDIFIEKGYFDLSAAKEYLVFAQELGFAVTIHADQLNRTQATQLAVALRAKSADHVICLNSKDKKRLADSETVAVLLPAADFYLECDYPDARTLIDSGACVALASDYNPGSSPTQNIEFVGLLARLQMKMALPEVFSALTYGGAKALGLEGEVGALLPGFRADFFLSNQSWEQFFYGLGGHDVFRTYVGGRKVFSKK